MKKNDKKIIGKRRLKNIFIILLIIFISYFLSNFITEKIYNYKINYYESHIYTLNLIIKIFNIILFMFIFNLFIFTYYKKAKEILFLIFFLLFIFSSFSFLLIINDIDRTEMINKNIELK